jgi:iron complex transport system substrate-binding protein
MQAKYIAIIIAVLVIGIAIGYGGAYIAPRPTITVTQTVIQTIVTTVTTTSTLTLPTTIAATIPITITTPVTVQASWPRTVVDALGREVKFNEPPKRVVSTIPSITEHLFALGLGDRVVGVDSYSNWPPEVINLTKEDKVAVVGGPWTLDIEKIVSLQPDLVLMCRGVKPQETQYAPKLEEMGVKTFFLICNAAKNQYDVYMDIRTLGKIFGVEQKAEELIKAIDDKIRLVTTKLSQANATKPRVLHLVGPPSWGLWSAGGDTFIGWMIEAAGGRNIASRYSGWPQLSYEYILSQDPEVIIITAHGVDPKKVADEVKQTPLANTTAWRTGRVYLLTEEADDMLSRPGPRIGDVLLLLAKIIHPEIFGEVERADVVKISEAVVAPLVIQVPAVGFDIASLAIPVEVQ